MTPYVYDIQLYQKIEFKEERCQVTIVASRYSRLTLEKSIRQMTSNLKYEWLVNISAEIKTTYNTVLGGWDLLSRNVYWTVMLVLVLSPINPYTL